MYWDRDGAGASPAALLAHVFGQGTPAPPITRNAPNDVMLVDPDTGVIESFKVAQLTPNTYFIIIRPKCPDSEVRIIARHTRSRIRNQKGTLAIYDFRAGFGFEVPTRTRGYNGGISEVRIIVRHARLRTSELKDTGNLLNLAIYDFVRFWIYHGAEATRRCSLVD